MKQILLTAAFFTSLAATAGPTARLTKQDYIEQWNKVAIEEMNKHRIPASITLAQGILESASGNSELAVKGKNHFGIKCHGWTGKKIYLDDDRAGECFRVYKSAKDSYNDHSQFLKKYDRYAFLFEYDVTDYKSWARGLKKAGYATSATYADKLIRLIEDLELHKYDGGSAPEIIAQPELIVSNEMISNTHEVQIHESKVKFVVAKKGDTFYKIAEEFGLTLGQLRRFNDFGFEKDVLEPGDIVYVQSKKRLNWFKKKKEIVVKKTMTVNELAQLYAKDAKAIMRMNDFTSGETVLSEGERVTLR